MIPAGGLRDSGPYTERFGWLQELPPSIVTRNGFGGEGTDFGEGSLDNMPTTAGFVGVYDRKGKLGAPVANVSATFGEFETQLRSLKDAGEVAIAFGNLGDWPAIRTRGEIQALYVDGAEPDDFRCGHSDVGCTAPEIERATAKRQKWDEVDYFTPDFSRIGYDDSWQDDTDGQGATKLQGVHVPHAQPATGRWRF